MGNTFWMETPVAIAGGGPVGMTLALQLARCGISSVFRDTSGGKTIRCKYRCSAGCRHDR